jgi:hypothetical protein
MKALNFKTISFTRAFSTKRLNKKKITRWLGRYEYGIVILCWFKSSILTAFSSNLDIIQTFNASFDKSKIDN